MTDPNVSTERRNHERFKIKNDAFALHREHNDQRKFGKILDISMGGLSFRYYGDMKRSSGSFEMDILLLDNSFRLKSLPAKIISDFVIAGREQASSRTVKRRSVQFVELIDSQISQLEYFIQQHSVPSASGNLCPNINESSR